jgi:hypothetical protein
MNNRGAVSALHKAGRREEQAKRKKDGTKATQGPAKKSKASSGNSRATLAPGRAKAWANAPTNDGVTTRPRGAKV